MCELASVRWMSRDKDSDAVYFWANKPELDHEGNWVHETEQSIAECSYNLLDIAPQEGEVAAVSIRHVMQTKVHLARRSYLIRQADGSFCFRESSDPPEFDCGHFAGVAMNRFGIDVADRICADHNLQPGEHCEIVCGRRADTSPEHYERLTIKALSQATAEHTDAQMMTK